MDQLTKREIIRQSWILIISIILFIVSLIFYFSIEESYVSKSEHNYICSIRKELKVLIKLKQEESYDIARSISTNKKFIQDMKNGKYKNLLNEYFLKDLQKNNTYKHIWVHVVDKEGFSRYSSWTTKGLNKYVLNKRADLKKIYKHSHIKKSISVGMFDITFKSIVPIYDKNHNFLGIVEVITHFNSIARNLAKNDIYSALVVEKRFTKQLIYPFSKLFINGYYISTLELNKDVKKLLLQNGVKYFINNPKEHEIRVSSFGQNYFITKVNIRGINGDVIAHYLLFIKDKAGLENKETLLNIVMLLIVFIFIFITYFGVKAHIKYLNVINNLSDKVKEETEKNLSLIYNDNLTTAYSKEKFFIDKEFYKNKELIMLNIRNFSKINDTYGFSVGDEILRLSVEKLQTILERRIYRIDSDEFVFISDDIDYDIHHIIHHFSHSDLLHIEKDDINLRILFSFSIVHGRDEDPLKKLGIAMKQAKKEPYKDYVYYKEKDIKHDFIKFNAYLYDAVFYEEEARIVPYFQGIRNNKTGKIIKYESLARLEVNGKIYSPYYFIEIAKSSGFLIEITRIMIDKSFNYLSKHNSKDITISINITEDDLYSKKLKEYLLEKLKFYNLKASQIVLEILEGVSAGGTHDSVIQLQDLKAEGFKLAIDDFGVEYSNFERIDELDVDFIKIDGKYIKNLDKNHKSYKIAKAIANFASSMEIKVIAEFVENEEIQKVVEELGIEFSQGYCFSVPDRNFVENL